MIFGIDLGSNTLRGVLMNKNGKILKSAEFIVGSARNLQAGGDLDPDAITRIKSALKKMDKQNFYYLLFFLNFQLIF